MGNSMEDIKNLKIELLYDPEIPLLGLCPEKCIVQKGTCTLIFIVSPFTMARTWKQPKCSQTEELVKKMWYIYTMEYYPAIKNEIMLFEVTWMDIERGRQILNNIT